MSHNHAATRIGLGRNDANFARLSDADRSRQMRLILYVAIAAAAITTVVAHVAVAMIADLAAAPVGALVEALKS
ncbi:MAG: hypothetical protein V4659_04035 [Pseudomonadota bacterium]